MSTCSSRISESRRSSGPENAVVSTTNPPSDGADETEGVRASGAYATVIRCAGSRQPLGSRQGEGAGPAEQECFEHHRGPQPHSEDAAAGVENDNQNQNSETAEPFVLHRPCRR